MYNVTLVKLRPAFADAEQTTLCDRMPVVKIKKWISPLPAPPTCVTSRSLRVEARTSQAASKTFWWGGCSGRARR